MTNSASLKYNAWSMGDEYLDVYGAEPGQNTFLGSTAYGTPLRWSTSDPNQDLYHPMNTSVGLQVCLSIFLSVALVSFGTKFMRENTGAWQARLSETNPTWLHHIQF